MQVDSERIIRHLGNRIRDLTIEIAVLKAQLDSVAQENALNCVETPSQKEENVV